MSSPSAARSTPQHAPELGLTHRLLGRFHVTGVFWYQFAYWGFTRPPLQGRPFVGLGHSARIEAPPAAIYGDVEVPQLASLV